jgi:hypothetical protein
MKTIRSPFLEIWVVGALGYKHFTAFRVTPSGIFVDLGSHELEMASQQTTFLKRGKRGLKPGFYDLGAVFLPSREVVNRLRPRAWQSSASQRE